MAIILSVLAAIIVFCGYLLFDQWAINQKRKASLRERIAPDGSHYDAHYSEDASLGLHGEPSASATALMGFLRMLGVDVQTAVNKLDRRFSQAGIASADGPIYYLFFQRIASLVLLILALMVALSGDEKTKPLMIAIGGFMAVIAVFGPQLYLQNMIDRRKKILQRAFPDTLDLLLICVESGLALDAALNRVCAELGRAYPEMTAELNRTRLELALINDRVRALMNLGERTGMTAFRSLISALIQTERFGTSLSDTLRVLSEEFRLQRLTDAEAKAARLPVLMTIPLIFLLMPAFFLIVLGPAIVNINNNGKQITGRR